MSRSLLLSWRICTCSATIMITAKAIKKSTFTGTIQLEVVKESGGTLDFYFQVFNNSSSLDAIMRLTTGNYTGFATDVDWTTNTAVGVASSVGVPSTSASRTTADTVGFAFSVPGSGAILPGTNS